MFCHEPIHVAIQPLPVPNTCVLEEREHDVLGVYYRTIPLPRTQFAERDEIREAYAES